MLDSPTPLYHNHAFEWWPEGKREQFQRLGYLIPAGESSHVRCPECRDHVEEVIASESPRGTRFFITCPEHIRVQVTHDDRRVWTPDFGCVAKGIASALRLRGAVRPLRDDRVWCCGRIDWHGREREVVFASGLDKREESLVLPGLNKLLHPIVLVPDEVPEPERWGREPPTVVALARFVDMDAHGLVVDRCALKAMILQAETGDKVADFVFLLSGDFWQVTFRGMTKHLKDTVGMGYLARLLAQPHRDIPAVSLLAARAGIDPLVTQGSSEKLIDEKARAEYREHYRDLEEEIADAEACHDAGRLERAQAERQQLVDELTRTAGLGGKLRERSDADRVRKSVSMAVNRDIENIAKHHEELGRHLQVSISSGLQFRYTPETPIDWLT
jgi:hypothetical protein